MPDPPEPHSASDCLAALWVLVFRAQQTHGDEVFPAVRVELGFPAHSPPGGSRRPGSSGWRGCLKASTSSLDPVQSEATEAPGHDQPRYLPAQSLVAQRGDEQAYRVGRPVLACVHPESGAADAAAIVLDRPSVLARLRPAGRGQMLPGVVAPAVPLPPPSRAVPVLLLWIDGMPQPVLDIGIPGPAQQHTLAAQHGQRRKRQRVRHDPDGGHGSRLRLPARAVLPQSSRPIPDRIKVTRHARRGR